MSEILSRNYQRRERCSILFIVLLTEPKDQWRQITFLSLFYINTTKRSKTIDLFKVSVVLTTSLTEESINQDYYYSHNFQQNPNNVTVQQGLIKRVNQKRIQDLFDSKLKTLMQNTAESKERIKLVAPWPDSTSKRNH